MADIDYDALVEEIIGLIRDDNEADAATVARMVEQLKEMRALAGRELLDSQVKAGEGLEGGGALADEPVLRLSDAVLAAVERAGAAVLADELAEQLKGLVTTDEVEKMVKKAGAGEEYMSVPFTRTEPLDGAQDSPVVVVPPGWLIDSMGVWRDSAAGSLTVTVQNTGTQVQLPRGTYTRTWDGSSKWDCPAQLKVRLIGTSEGPTTVNIILRRKRVG